LETAITEVYAAGRCITRDQGGTATTTEFCSAIAKRL
jgi:isocitrate/isopropylmalate dehydrogenase